MELIKKFQMVILAVLIVNSISCARVIPVKLELPNKPTYHTDISKGVTTIQDGDQIVHFIVTMESMKKLAKNKAVCREDNDTLRKIIKTTH